MKKYLSSLAIGALILLMLSYGAYAMITDACGRLSNCADGPAFAVWVMLVLPLGLLVLGLPLAVFGFLRLRKRSAEASAAINARVTRQPKRAMNEAAPVLAEVADDTTETDFATAIPPTASAASDDDTKQGRTHDMDNLTGGDRAFVPHSMTNDDTPRVEPRGEAAADTQAVNELLTTLEQVMTGTEPTAQPMAFAPEAAPVAEPVKAPAQQWAPIGHSMTLRYDDAGVSEYTDAPFPDPVHCGAADLVDAQDTNRLKPLTQTGFPWTIGVVQEVAQAALVLVPASALGGYRQEAEAWLTLAAQLPSVTPIVDTDADAFAEWIEQLCLHSKSMGSPAGLSEVLDMALRSIRTRAVEDARFGMALPEMLRA